MKFLKVPTQLNELPLQNQYYHFYMKKSNFRVIAATHDIELAELLKQRYENYHFNEVIENNNIHFDYKIKPGKANTRNAIELLKITSFPAKIYERAKDNVPKI